MQVGSTQHAPLRQPVHPCCARRCSQPGRVTAASNVCSAGPLARLNAHLPLDAKVGTLPVAQRQIVAICRGLAVNARVLFMDEPTASLTRREVELLLETVRRLKALGVAVVFVSHRLEEVVEIAERVTVLRDGRKVGTFPASKIDDHSLAELMTGESIVHAVTARPLPDARPALEVRGASRAGEFENVSLVVRRGEILSVIGLLGAGRTELALALFGMAPLERGEILLDGAPLILRPNQDAVRAGIAYVSEDRLTLGLNLKQSIADNIAITVLDRLADAIGLGSPSRRNRLASDWIARLGIRTPNADSAVLTLSGGNQQRVVLAKWLATDPKVLILDSPTVGVDVRNKQGIYELVRRLAAQGVAILFVSDEIPEVYYNSDRILHMRNGRIVGEFVFVIVALAAHVLLTRTELGVRIHMIGSNLEATRFSGVNTRRVQVWVYLISSILSWLAAIIMMARFNSAGADIAQSYLLITILAAILGGIDPYGGFGGVGGLFVALWILQVVASGFNLMNVSPRLALASWGLILLLVMAVKRFAGTSGRFAATTHSQSEVLPALPFDRPQEVRDELLVGCGPPG